MDNWNKQNIHDLFYDIETTPDATTERNALLNLFDYVRQLEQQNKRYEKILHNIANIDAMFLNPDGTERDFSEKEALIAIERMVAPVWIEHCKKSWENNTALQNNREG